MGEKIPLERIDANRWRIPMRYNDDMHVPGMIYADDELIESIVNDNALQQVVNVATLPGIVGHSLGMPDIHWGYGFPVGGVAATDAETGVISPGGIGFDINCGVRLLATDLLYDQVKGKVSELADQLYNTLPSGVGTDGMRILSADEMRDVMVHGAQWAVDAGYGLAEDLEVTEENGCLEGADPSTVSKHALERGRKQLGSLGSGNHFCEVQVVDHIYDQEVANVLGIGRKGQVVTTLHCGSRGIGHQVAEEFINLAESKQKEYGFELVDKQLACLPINSVDGQAYLGAMRCAANFAWANRQLLMHGVRQSFANIFGRKARPKDLPLVYDVCHNIAKMEEYEVDGQLRKLCVHRKGATRSFPAGHPAIPEKYRAVGQPVLIPGDMGRYSFMLVGDHGSMEQTFGSCCHGAGRRLSRTAAKKAIGNKELLELLEKRGITVRVHSKNLLSEESPQAYKDAQQVVNVVHNAGLAKLVVRLKPVVVVKG
ncbi:RtcB family protein [Tengunoibacter tsumagoiensis]|uniref:tRNA-splicing ligase RtcB n=1 Tax=Tengunoibacter tsumagoiensis TaxID=2014871 RepID=A0A402A1L1_9CHLR|nr:RtcB family protein [Tengunoibacter tsumagoiensis]GCE13038.1 RNA-splicing ligase RtcB [Tengunoibacter tsumagoiensis]